MSWIQYAEYVITGVLDSRTTQKQLTLSCLQTCSFCPKIYMDI